MHVIENEFLRVKARSHGAELTSIFDKTNHVERLWQADPVYWPWHSPVLFPVVGACLNDEIVVGDKKYPMAKHGFARKTDFKLMDISESQMTFSISETEDTLRSYPYRFEFLISYKLDLHQLIVSYEVINKDDEQLYFSVGGHPAFAAPLKAGESYEDYFIEFEQEETAARFLIDENGLFDGRTEPVLNQSKMIGLRKDLFLNDALIFKTLKSRKVSLKSVKNPYFIEMDFSGFNYLGIWAKPNASYVCLEPWLGCADTADHQTDLFHKEAILSLEPTKRFLVDYKITVG